MRGLKQLLLIGAAIGGGMSRELQSLEPRSGDSEFVRRSKAYRLREKQYRTVHSGNKPFTDGRPHVGKKQTRLTKRLKVAAMKAAGHFRSDHRPFLG